MSETKKINRQRDEELIRNLIVTYLSKLGHSCATATDGVDALGKLKADRFDTVVTDIKMPKMDGIMLTMEILKQHPEIPVMVMTAFDEEYSAGMALSFGARDFIKKPFSLDEFAIRFRKMLSDSKTFKKARHTDDQDVCKLMIELENTLQDGHPSPDAGNPSVHLKS